MALAGVMGLANSEVGAETTEHPAGERLLRAHAGAARQPRPGPDQRELATASSAAPTGRWWRRPRCGPCTCCRSWPAARVVPDWADRHDPDRRPPPAVPLRVWQVNRVLGTGIDTDEAAQLLQSPGPEGAADGQSRGQQRQRRQHDGGDPQLPARPAAGGRPDRGDRPAATASTTWPAGGGFRGRRRRPAPRRGTWPWTGPGSWLAACGYHEMVTSSFHGRRRGPTAWAWPTDDPRRQTLAVINPHHGGDTRLRTMPAALAAGGGPAQPQRGCSRRRCACSRSTGSTGRPDARPPTRGTRTSTCCPQEPLFLQVGLAGWRESGLGGVPARPAGAEGLP